MTRKQRRLILIGSSLGVLAFAVALVLSSLRESIVFFNSPTDIAEKKSAAGTRVRLGGMVKVGSLQRGDNLQLRFEVTDGNKDIPVSYRGIVPDLLREGQGVVAEGHIEPGGTFMADTMIAELGHYALVLALALALIQSSSPVIGARKGDVALMKLADSTALAQFAFVALAFAALTICYVTSDFSVANVYEN